MAPEPAPLRLPRLSRAERVLAALFLLSLPLVNPYLRGDGNGYFAYVRSLAIDGDLQFENEYRRADPDYRNVTFRYADGHLRLPLVTTTGHTRNQWAVGPALLWTPAFLEAHAAVLALRALGNPVEDDGFSFPYRWACAMATAFYAFAGLLLAHRIARRVAAAPFALAATLAVWAASPLPIYMYFLPFYAHASAAFTVALFLWFWVRQGPIRTVGAWALWGALWGLAFEVYYLDGVVALAAAVEWLARAREEPRTPRRRWAVLLAGRGAAFALGAAAALLPQFAAKWVLHGSPFDTGRTNRFFWDAPRLWDVAFASEHGIFAWTPLLAAAALGLLCVLRRDRVLGGTLCGIFATFFYVVASYERWHGVSGFGSRFFVSLTPVFVVGMAALMEDAHAVLGSALRRLAAPALARRAAWACVLVPVTLAAAWNVGFMFQWGTGMIPRQGPVDLLLVARNQFTTVPRRIAGFGLRYLRQREQVVREQERPPAPR